MTTILSFPLISYLFSPKQYTGIIALERVEGKQDTPEIFLLAQVQIARPAEGNIKLVWTNLVAQP